jgi:hypothetical protein
LFPRSPQPFLPQARTDKLVVQTLPDETLVYDLTRKKAHCLNRTTAWVWERCDGQTAVPDMASRLGDDLNAPVPEEVVWLALEQLEQAHLLRSRTPAPLAGTRMSRRSMVRQLGMGAAIAIPAILSIIAPEAAEAASCKVDGTLCTSSSQCCSGCCRLVGGVPTCKSGMGGCI